MPTLQKRDLPTLGLIGCGGVAAAVLDGLAAANAQFSHAVILARPQALGKAKKLLDLKTPGKKAGIVTSTLDSFLAEQPHVVVEAASHAAIQDYAEKILRAGIDLIPASIGAFSDSELHGTCLRACESAKSHIHISNGAVGGLDILRAAVLSGNAQVRYMARKPPEAWRGSGADAMTNLDTVTSAETFFSSSARIAARDFPKNANVTAAIALAGLGFDQTQVELIVDPDINENIHELAVEANGAKFALRVNCLPSQDNPRTSVIAGFSLARSVLNIWGQQVI